MKKNSLYFILILGLSLVGCNQASPSLRGTYQSEWTQDDYIIQLSFNAGDETFVQYIDNRAVDQGIFKKEKDNTYRLKSDVQEITISLKEADIFEITINNMNSGQPIKLMNIDKTPIIFETDFDDIEQYKDLLAD